jgi:hypothetical protein
MRHNRGTSNGFPEPCHPGSPSPKHSTGRERGQFTEFHQQHDRSEDGIESAAGVSEMPLARNEFGGEASDAAELLALLEVRRRVQPGAADGFVAPGLAMKAAPPKALAVLSETVLQLQDLILALDRRLPQVQRSGESEIANAAVRLRTEACKRISELEAEIAGRPSENGRPVTFE